MALRSGRHIVEVGGNRHSFFDTSGGDLKHRADIASPDAVPDTYCPTTNALENHFTDSGISDSEFAVSICGVSAYGKSLYDGPNFETFTSGSLCIKFD